MRLVALAHALQLSFYDLLFQIMQNKAVSTKLAATADEDGVIFVYVFNHVRLAEARNSIASLKRFGRRSNILVFAMDHLVCEQLSLV